MILLILIALSPSSGSYPFRISAGVPFYCMTIKKTPIRIRVGKTTFKNSRGWAAGLRPQQAKITEAKRPTTKSSIFILLLNFMLI
ncbi:MAG: hypothetical protein ACE5IT_00620 [bacterium]